MDNSVQSGASEPSREDKQEQRKGVTPRVVTAIAVLVAIYLLAYESGALGHLGVFLPAEQVRAIALGAFLVLIFLKGGKRGTSGRPSWFSLLAAALSLAAAAYVVFFPDNMARAQSQGYADLPEIVMGFLVAALILEGVRRLLGLAAFGVILFFLIHPFLSNYLPGILHGRGYDPSRVMYVLYAGDYGIYGFVMGLAAGVMLIFVLFGQFLQACGGGSWFIKLALAMTGHVVGGPAKSAVVASALFGSVSGSPIANVATTGAVTIPLMKSVGYTPSFAGGVETVASTGGLIMPPIMGAVAFIMADWLGVSYWEVCVAAIVPALLFYIAVLIMVHQQAQSLGLKTTPKSELPSLGKTLAGGWYWLAPLLAIVWFLAVSHYPASTAGFYALIMVVVLSMIKKETRLTLGRTIASLKEGMMHLLPAGVACAGVGIIIGSVTLTGIGVKLSGYIVDWSGGNLLLLLSLAAATSLILGMGMPAIPAYVIVVALVAPAMVKLDVLPIGAHLFAFYFAMLSFITPPVAVAAYTAGAIAQVSPISCALQACRLALVAYLIPFAFVYHPSLLLQGSVPAILFSLAATTLGTVALGCGAIGYLRGKVGWVSRIGLLAGGGSLMFLRGIPALIGLGLLIAVVLVPQILPRMGTRWGSRNEQ